MKEQKILLINDNFELRDAVQMRLEDMGFITYGADNGEHALNLLKNENFDLILCDYDMPVMDGPEFRAKQKISHPKIPFVLLCSQSNIAEKAKELEAADYFDIIEVKTKKRKITEIIEKNT